MYGSAYPDAERLTPALPRRLAQLRRAVLRRQAAIAAWLSLPIAGALLAVVYRAGGGGIASAGAALLLIGGVVRVRRSMRLHDATWLLRRLNTLLPAFEDSLELAVLDYSGNAPAPPLGGLRRLQSQRIRQRLQETSLPDIRGPYPWRRIAIAWGCALLVLILAGPLAPALRVDGHLHPLGPHAASAVPFGSLHIVPPAYTRLPARSVMSLDAKVPAGSRVDFDIRAGSASPAAALQFHEGARLDLSRDGAEWRGTRAFEESTLYRVQLGGAPPAAAALHRIDVIPDRPPDITVHVPQRSLNLLAAGQKSWDLEFEATDDYGLGPAELSVTLAQGSGENIKSSQRTLRLEGSGDDRHRVYRKTLTLTDLGFGVGDDLIVRLTVSDNHPSPPHRTQSASFILRWPAQAEAASEGMEGLVEKAMPAYFSSERQLIIDSEALAAERNAIEPRRFASRADDLGVEQKVLRLRYGQFLGEEFESNAERAPPGYATGQGNAALKDIPPESAATPPPKSVGDPGNVAGEFGHVHDKPEAATLLDPDTRRLLKLALDEMWQAELQLREADPDHALPFEHKALEYIKQVQQAERIYLARAGVQLPQVDAARRLTGDRAALSDRDAALPAAAPGDSAARDLWRTLEAGGTPDWAALTRWAQRHRTELPDALALLSAADRAQHDPRCADCRATVERQLWPLLSQPPSALSPRTRPDTVGAAYLDALSQPPAAPGP